MRTLLGMASLLIALPLAACGGGAQPASIASRRLFCESGCDGGEGLATSLGTVSLGHRIEKQLRLRNQSGLSLSTEGLRLDGAAGLKSSVFCERGCPGDRLPPGGAIVVQLAWAPSQAGELRAETTLHLGDDAVPLRVTGEAAPVALECTPAILDFGSVSPGETRSLAITCENHGTGSLDLAVGPLPAGFTTAQQHASLGAGEQTVVEVLFFAGKSSSGTFELHLPDGSVAQSTALVASVGDALAIDPAAPADGCYRTGWVPPGGSTELAFTLQNTGDRTLSLDPPTLQNGSDPSFSLVDAGPISLAPGETHTLSVRFSPTIAGRKRATLTLGGSGIARTICVEGRGGGPVLRCDPTTLEFGPVATGRERVRTIRCTNDGWDDPTTTDDLLRFEGWTGSGSWNAFGLSRQLEPLAAGESTVAEIRFAAIAVGRLEATLHLQTNAGVVDFQLGGDGVELPPCAPLIEPAGALDFGPIGALPITREVTLRNDRSAACVVGDVAIGGTGASRFALVSNEAPSILEAGAARRIAVRALPSDAVSQSRAELQIAYGEAKPVKRLDLLAASGSSCLRVASAPVAIAPAGCTSTAQAIRVENHCPVQRTIDSVVLEDEAAGIWELVDVQALRLEPGEIAPVARVRFGSNEQGIRYTAARVGSAAGDLLVPLAGSGGHAAQQEDHFAPDAVDVLFLVPSGSGLSTDDATPFLAAALAGGSDFRVAFAGVEKNGSFGSEPTECWPGRVSGNGAYLAPDRSQQELRDAWSSLSNLPRCPLGDPDGIAIGAAFSPAFLDGTNGRFFRSDARLAVVFLSADPWPLENFARDPYWIGRVERMRQGPGRAMLLAEGVARSGTDADMSWRIADPAALGRTVFTRPACYELAAVPAAPDAIEVAVDGMTLERFAPDGTERFSYEPTLNQVCFAPAAIPRADATIDIRYAPGCAP